jgi:hypothetical protein
MTVQYIVEKLRYVHVIQALIHQLSPAFKKAVTMLLLYGCTLAALATYARVAWVNLYPYKPIIIHSPMPVLNPGKSIKAGGVIRCEFKSNKMMPLSATVTQQLINSFVFTLASPPVEDAPPGKSSLVIPLPIPLWAEPGVYHIHNTYSYVVSEFPRRVVTVEADSENFTIIQ